MRLGDSVKRYLIIQFASDDSFYRDYSVLFTLYNTGELSCKLMGSNGFKVKTENERFIVICSRCRQNLKFGDFTLLFCGVRQINAQKFVLHLQHEYFSLFNQ